MAVESAEVGTALSWFQSNLSSLKQEALLGEAQAGLQGWLRAWRLTSLAVGLHAVVWDLRKVISRAGQKVRDQAVFCPCQLNTPNMKGKIS